jgi:hypothetical protein
MDLFFHHEHSLLLASIALEQSYTTGTGKLPLGNPPLAPKGVDAFAELVDQRPADVADLEPDISFVRYTSRQDESCESCTSGMVALHVACSFGSIAQNHAWLHSQLRYHFLLICLLY